MYFLINYNRKEGRLVKLTEYKSGEDAFNAKLSIEIEAISDGISNEIVVLEAESKSDLMSSHARYFKDFSEIQIENDR